MSASEGASTTFTNVISSRTSRHRCVSSAGLAIAPSRAGDNPRISGFRITSPTAFSASVAASTTLGCVSTSVSLSRGTICGKHAPSCFGAHADIAPSILTEPCFVRHALSSKPSMIAGRTSLTPCAESWPMTARAALAVASRTNSDWSPNRARSIGRTWMTYGSNSRPRRTLRSSNAMSAPSRASGLVLSSTASLTLSMIPKSFSDPMPIPFTAPASPYAAPRRAAYPSPRAIVSSRPSTSSLRSSSSSAGMSGGRQSATDRCTCSEGVARTSTRRLRICLTFGSSRSRWHASAPKNTATPRRTKSPRASLSPAPPPRSKYPSYTPRSCLTCSAP